MSLSQFVDRHQNSAPLHSNAYAQVAQGNTIGSMDAQSFNQRRKIEHSRQAVRRYGDSMIGRGHMKEVARPQIASSPVGQSGPAFASRQRLNTRGTAMRPTGTRAAIPPRTFTEPPTRYDPYS